MLVKDKNSSELYIKGGTNMVLKKIRKIDATLMIILMITLFFTGNFPVHAQEVTNKHPASVQLVTGYVTGLYETDQSNITAVTVDLLVTDPCDRNNHYYEEYYLYVEDSDYFIGDGVLVVLDDKGTASKTDDVIYYSQYWEES